MHAAGTSREQKKEGQVFKIKWARRMATNATDTTNTTTACQLAAMYFDLAA
jgi:hypothetical protein